jgi:hypothetical protein
MWKRGLVMMTALVGSSCGGLVTDPMPDIPEQIEYDTVRVNYGEPDAEDGPLGMRGQALVGSQSGLARTTRDAVRQANELIYAPFALIEQSVQFPPTRYEDEAWIWETSRQAPYMRLELRIASAAQQIANAELTTVYTLYYGASATDARPFFEAIFGRFPRRLGRQQGAGLLRINFDALRAYKQDAPRGDVRIAFRVSGGVRQVAAAYKEVQRAEDIEPLSSEQRYVELPGGQGQLEFAAKDDWLKDGAPLELMIARSRWTRQRAGRIAARLQGGSLALTDLVLEQCWDADSVSVYERSRPMIMDFGGGDEADCARALTIDQAPDRPRAFNGDPDIPARHPSEE